jgi:pimeloyl-ACP methyl ester carboxylesterase
MRRLVREVRRQPRQAHLREDDRRLAALLEHRQTGRVDVLGWSDGGIEALLLGIRHPAKVKKIVAMAANLNPGDKAVRPDNLDLIRQSMAVVPAADRDTPRGQRELKSLEKLRSLAAAPGR